MGGVGWEFLAMGVPFMHRYDLSNSEYFKYTGHDLPKFINTCTSQEVCNVILDLEKNPKNLRKLVVNSKIGLTNITETH